jgi:hypothetical protein
METTCIICDNNLEITNRVFSTEQQNNISDNIASDTSINSSVDTTNFTEEDIENIVNNNMHDVKINSKNFNIDDIYKNQFFNKLTDNKKTLVINRINDKISKTKTKTKAPSKAKIIAQKLNENTMNNVYKKESYFYCKSCGYNTSIPSKTLIFSRGNVGKFFTKGQEYYKDISIYPIQKNYTCINDDCKTHNEPSLKNAVIHRIPGEYIVNYTCNVCNYVWNTYNSNKS